jgi:hypothetical protein
LIERLPAWGQYKSDLAMDEDWATYVLDVMEKEGEALPGAEDRITPHGYTDVIARLDLIADRVLSVRTAVQAGYTQDHEEPHFETLPRPETAVERAREDRVRNELEELDRQFREGIVLNITGEQ